MKKAIIVMFALVIALPVGSARAQSWTEILNDVIDVPRASEEHPYISRPLSGTNGPHVKVSCLIVGSGGAPHTSIKFYAMVDGMPTDDFLGYLNCGTSDVISDGLWQPLSDLDVRLAVEGIGSPAFEEIHLIIEVDDLVPTHTPTPLPTDTPAPTATASGGGGGGGGTSTPTNTSTPSGTEEPTETPGPGTPTATHTSLYPTPMPTGTGPITGSGIYCPPTNPCFVRNVDGTPVVISGTVNIGNLPPTNTPNPLLETAIAQASHVNDPSGVSGSSLGEEHIMPDAFTEINNEDVASFQSELFDFGCPIGFDKNGVSAQLCIKYRYVTGIKITGIDIPLAALFHGCLVCVVIYMIRKR